MKQIASDKRRNIGLKWLRYGNYGKTSALPQGAREFLSCHIFLSCPESPFSQQVDLSFCSQRTLQLTSCKLALFLHQISNQKSQEDCGVFFLSKKSRGISWITRRGTDSLYFTHLHTFQMFLFQFMQDFEERSSDISNYSMPIFATAYDSCQREITSSLDSALEMTRSRTAGSFLIFLLISLSKSCRML